MTLRTLAMSVLCIQRGDNYNVFDKAEGEAILNLFIIIEYKLHIISIGYMAQFIVVCIQIKMLHDKILKTIKCDILNVNSDGKIGVSYLTNQTNIKIREI